MVKIVKTHNMPYNPKSKIIPYQLFMFNEFDILCTITNVPQGSAAGVPRSPGFGRESKSHTKQRLPDPGHVLLLDCTLSTTQFQQFFLVMLPQACPVIIPLCLLVRYCAPFIIRIRNFSQVILKYTISKLHHSKS